MGERRVDEMANAQRRRAFLRTFPVCLGRLKLTPDSLVRCGELAVVVVGGKGEEKGRGREMERKTDAVTN